MIEIATRATRRMLITPILGSSRAMTHARFENCPVVFYRIKFENLCVFEHN